MVLHLTEKTYKQTFIIMTNFNLDKEQEAAFAKAGPIYHINSPENFGIIFRNNDDFKAGMLLMSLCSTSFQDVVIYAFELMNNHFHCVLGGDGKRVIFFYEEYRTRLKKYCTGVGNILNWDKCDCHAKHITTLENFRNVIAYVHRNGAMAYHEYTPISYPWGTNSLYFNPELKIAHRMSAERVLWETVRMVSHSHKFDDLNDISAFNGVASMANVCAIEEGENFFRDARQYFFKISRDVEKYREIAEMIGESVYYTDDEMLVIAIRLSSEKFGESRLSLLNPSVKMELARKLRYEYNSGIKQLQRILHLDESALKTMFSDDRA